MKKVLSLALVLILCLSLFACAKQPTVEDELQGSWKNDGSIWEFNDGRFSSQISISGVTLDAKEGTYEITDDAIILKYDNGVESELEYTFEDGTLSLDGLTKE